MAPDHQAPVAELQVWYHVGSKDEQRGRTGFAHLFEHLMFDGTHNLAPNEFSNYIVRAGGTDNAYTTEDATVFWETIPSVDLPVALWLEADRMRNLAITPSTFRNEREVVEEERRQRFGNQPYGDVVEILYAHAFAVSPYRHMPIGSMEDLERASVRDVQSFYDTYYVPDNATLVLTGSFDQNQAKQDIQQYFGPLRGTGRPIRREYAREPPQTSERVVRLTQNVALPAFIEGYHMPADGTPDSYPLRLAAKILADGESSWIYRRLVYEKQMAMQVESEGNFTELPNLFFIFAVMNPGYSPAQGEREVESVLDRLRAGDLKKDDLNRAQNQILRDFIMNRQSAQGRADALGYDAVILKHPDLYNTQLSKLMEVTAGDVHRVAQKYFVQHNLTVVEVYPRMRDK
ncbi:MAG: M16 family metallopeptidase [Terriglobia bacterium]